ncbi:hypothetical protein [Erythrobacter sp. HL-111]|uniref:hypothetical protein n=1 Tax=Erythrobacter sp. HL-111 TaxID=1798193 RepID=UPI0006DA4A93|nr:hypothetical protein [Erythrobacter sp. HL-111]KPP89440.1 MAG: hypothetical protein HLUCCO15_10195 [Erythrobacteraceae bacterium HL-111]SDS49737.1 hypothetical protein SAMN04515621_1677 [Erythrobacter sp. HL-111]
MSHAPSPEDRAITATSIKSAPIGAAIIALLFFKTPLIGAILTLASGEWQAVLLVCLPYALPAAILYRREILLESSLP